LLSNTPTGTATNDCLTISGGNVIDLDTPTGGAATDLMQRIFTGAYRKVGALYTGNSTPAFVCRSHRTAIPAARQSGYIGFIHNLFG
jgi:hypothetical protein